MSRVFGEMNQICCVVHEIDAAIQYWGETLGVGPWSLTRHVEVTGFECEGKPSDLDITYFKTPGLLGTYSELISLDDLIEEALEGLKSASRAWDGKGLMVPSFP